MSGHAGPVIIECAINGVTSPDKNPHVPRKPADIVADTYRALDAGASVIHAHNSDFALRGEEAARDYLMAWQPILARRPDTLWYPTLCGGDGAAHRAGRARVGRCRGARRSRTDREAGCGTGGRARVPAVRARCTESQTRVKSLAERRT